MKLYKNYIDGKWIESESKEIIQVDDPSNGKIIGEISCAKKTEVDLAVSAAKNAFSSRVLVDMPILERAKLMHRIAEETRKIRNFAKNTIKNAGAWYALIITGVCGYFLNREIDFVSAI